MSLIEHLEHDRWEEFFRGERPFEDWMHAQFYDSQQLFYKE